ncbi:MAG: TlpA family protein disulfide reductase [Hyphomicrobiaceae bacterium]
MVTRRQWLAGLGAGGVAVVVATGSGAMAFEGAAYDAKTFAQAQAEGRPILIEVHAGWCPVCWKQGPLLTTLLKQPEFARVLRITVEFDMEKDVLKVFGVTRQSTLIVFKGAQETGRSIGEVDPARLEALLRSAL